MNNWFSCKLGDILTFQRGHDLPKIKMIHGVYPVVGSNGIIGYHNEYTTETPSITIGRSGNTGNPFIVYGRTWSHNTTLYIKEFKDSDPVFIYYLLRTLDLSSFAGGSAVPTLNRNHIHTLDVTIPPLSTQTKIGHTLRVLDEKIANNTAINNHLPLSRSAMYSSPDISRGNRLSRKVARCVDSALLACICKNIGLTISSNFARLSLLGKTISKVLRTAVVILGTAEPTFIPAKSWSRMVKYEYFATLGRIICV